MFNIKPETCIGSVQLAGGKGTLLLRDTALLKSEWIRQIFQTGRFSVAAQMLESTYEEKQFALTMRKRK